LLKKGSTEKRKSRRLGLAESGHQKGSGNASAMIDKRPLNYEAKGKAKKALIPKRGRKTSLLEGQQLNPKKREREPTKLLDARVITIADAQQGGGKSWSSPIGRQT